MYILIENIGREYVCVNVKISLIQFREYYSSFEITRNFDMKNGNIEIE